jgi:hypothetical protein
MLCLNAGADTAQEYLQMELDGLVYFRGGCAERYPEDSRNQQAVTHAKWLLTELPKANELLLARLQKVDGQLADQWNRLDPEIKERTDMEQVEEHSAFWRAVGFHHEYFTIDELIEDVIQFAEERLEGLKEDQK